MKFVILTLFPEYFDILNLSILGKAKDKNLIDFDIIDIREFSTNKHKKVDDYTYGGGDGMLMAVQPLWDCLEHIKKKYDDTFMVYLSPRGKVLNHNYAKEISKSNKTIVLICGHYEGIDQRIIDNFVDTELSIGDYILTGGELPALVFIDVLSRLESGVLSKNENEMEESFYNDLLEYNQYTRPAEYKGHKVPDVLLSGNHKLINEYRHNNSLEITKINRPDLYKKYILKNNEK